MVNIIKRAGDNLDGFPASVLATPVMCGLCRFFLQSPHEDDKPSNIADYANLNLAESQAIHNHAYKAYLAVFMLLSLKLQFQHND